MSAKYSYEYEFIKPIVKHGIKVGDKSFFDKKKGDALVKDVWLKFVCKYRLGMSDTGGTALIPCK